MSFYKEKNNLTFTPLRSASSTLARMSTFKKEYIKLESRVAKGINWAASPVNKRTSVSVSTSGFSKDAIDKVLKLLTGLGYKSDTYIDSNFKETILFISWKNANKEHEKY